MRLLSVTQHARLVDRLRTAFEGAGHQVDHVPNHLVALATEAWRGAHVLLMDAKGDPLDGYGLCHLLRAESRALFRTLPIFLILEEPAGEADLIRLKEVDGDGFIQAEDSVHGLLGILGPMLGGNYLREGQSQGPVVAASLGPGALKALAEAVRFFGFDLVPCSLEDLPLALARHRPPFFFLGLDDASGRALEFLRAIPGCPLGPYPILVGELSEEGAQRQFITAGAMDWIPLPLSTPLILHACRRALEWIHAKRIQKEYQARLGDLMDRRLHLEEEASALRDEVITDSLTGLLNRKAFTQNLDHAISQWQRHQSLFSLLLGDLDFFKLTNDRFGHLAGDEVLKGVARHFRSTLRRTDLAFRIGGEEFAIILSGTGLEAGKEVAEKVRRRIDTAPIHLDSGQVVFPTMSFGLGVPGMEDGEALFARVDQALYRAKSLGRNRVELALPPEEFRSESGLPGSGR
jgi:diguanylate cyclase (GGDEF)-like protein